MGVASQHAERLKRRMDRLEIVPAIGLADHGASLGAPRAAIVVGVFIEAKLAGTNATPSAAVGHPPAVHFHPTASQQDRPSHLRLRHASAAPSYLGMNLWALWMDLGAL